MMFGLRSLRAASVQRMQPGKLRAGRAAEGLTKMVLIFHPERMKMQNYKQDCSLYTSVCTHTHTLTRALWVKPLRDFNIYAA